MSRSRFSAFFQPFCWVRAPKLQGLDEFVDGFLRGRPVGDAQDRHACLARLELPDRVGRDAVRAAARTPLDDLERLLELDDRRVLPGRAQRRVDPEACPGAESARVDPGEVEPGEEVIGVVRPPGEVGDQLERRLTGGVDFDFGADRTHRGGILLVGRGRAVRPASRRRISPGERRAQSCRSHPRRPTSHRSRSPPSAPAPSSTRRSSGSATGSKRCSPSRAPRAPRTRRCAVSSTPCARTPASTSRSGPSGSNASSAAGSTASRQRTERLEARIDQVEADRAAAEVRIHAQTERDARRAPRRAAHDRRAPRHRPVRQFPDLRP